MVTKFSLIVLDAKSKTQDKGNNIISLKQRTHTFYEYNHHVISELLYLLMVVFVRGCTNTCQEIAR